jgi:SAM-dependent methyltransferase
MLSTNHPHIPTRQEIFTNSKCVSYIWPHLLNFLRALGATENALLETSRGITDNAREINDDALYEERVHRLLELSCSLAGKERALEERADRVFNQLSPHLMPGTTLDFGCGDGQIGEHVQEKQGGVTLADTYRHPNIDRLELPFLLLPQEGASGAPSDSFDNLLAVTVLHHCLNPQLTLSEMARVTRLGGYLLVIESVYGCGPSLFGEHPLNPATREFTSLSAFEQVAVTAFFDHLYNRCLFYSNKADEKVTTPYNYMPPEGWVSVFDQHGLKAKSVIYLGVDQLIAPIFHVLFILRKRRP